MALFVSEYIGIVDPLEDLHNHSKSWENNKKQIRFSLTTQCNFEMCWQSMLFFSFQIYQDLWWGLDKGLRDKAKQVK